MADREHKGLVARWLEGKERDEEYARSTLPTNRWSLFWDILKGRFGRLMLVNLLMLLTFLPAIAVIVWRYLWLWSEGIMGPFAGGLGVGASAVPPDQLIGVAELMVFQADLMFFGLLIPCLAIAAIGISGGAYIIRNLIWTEGIFVANDFVRGIKRNYWNVLEAVLIFGVALFMVRTMANLAELFIAQNLASRGWMIASETVGYVLIVFLLLVCMWMISLGINYKQGPWTLFRNAIVMTVGTILQTVFFAALASIPFVLSLFGGTFFAVIGVVILALFGISYAFLVWMDFSQWAFDKFVNPNFGIATGRGLYNKESGKMGGKEKEDEPQEESEAMREYRRMIVAQGKSMLVSRPIKPIDDDIEIYQLPESFSREDLQKLRESKEFMEEDVKAYEEAHKNDAQYVEYNKEFEERERAIQEDDGKGKKKPVKKPKMLNKRK